jgi:CheY-like chemotaxis protein
MSEWLKEHAWKACIRGNADRGFESLSLRSYSKHPFFPHRDHIRTSHSSALLGGIHWPSGGIMNILLVDDKKEILDTMGEILEICLNHKVQGASSGKEALKLMRKNRYDLMVIDLALPVMNGLEVIKRVRKVKPQMHIVVLTGVRCNDLLRDKLNELDVKEVFQKPKGIHDLLFYLKKLPSKDSVA